MLNLPIAGPLPRMDGHRQIEIVTPAAAWLEETSLSAYLESADYLGLIEPLQRRMDADASYREWGLLASGWGVVGLRDLDRAYAVLESALAEHPFPEACRGCAKADGW
jgi:hypothetical protein